MQKNAVRRPCVQVEFIPTDDRVYSLKMAVRVASTTKHASVVLQGRVSHQLLTYSTYTCSSSQCCLSGSSALCNTPSETSHTQSQTHLHFEEKIAQESYHMMKYAAGI